MLSKLSNAALTINLAALLLVSGQAILPAYADRAAEPRVVNVDQMNRRQFREMLKTLPDATLIELKGERITAAELRANMRVSDAAARSLMQQMTPTAHFGRHAEVKLQVRRAEFLRQTQAKLESENAASPPSRCDRAGGHGVLATCEDYLGRRAPAHRRAGRATSERA
jgi:hypothetical protein